MSHPRHRRCSKCGKSVPMQCPLTEDVTYHDWRKRLRDCPRFRILAVRRALSK